MANKTSRARKNLGYLENSNATERHQICDVNITATELILTIT